MTRYRGGWIQSSEQIYSWTHEAYMKALLYMDSRLPTILVKDAAYRLGL